MTERLIDMVVTQSEPVNGGTLKITLAEANGGDLPSWEPGAHIDLYIPAPDREIVRQYSLCGVVEDRKHFQVAVLNAEDSRGGSRFIHGSIRVGDRLRVGGPRNHFPFLAANSYLFIAGGIGITPILPMIAAAEASGADWTLLFCARTRETMPFVTDLLSRRGNRIKIHESRANGRADLAAHLLAARPDAQVYCCGPEPMILDIEKLGESLQGDRVHVERFSPRELEISGPDESFEVEFAQSGHVVTILPGQTILGVAEDLGLDIDSSCQEGTCGTCETRVISGVPDHRDSVLSPKERAANKTMMICVSRACSRRLVLDA